MGTPIFSIPEVATNQTQKETTINNATVWLEGALADDFAVTFTSNAATLSSTQYTQHMSYSTGTAAANSTLTIPLVKKLFIVDNSAGVHTITVGGASGASVAVPAGAMSICRCDGTDVHTVTALASLGGVSSVAGNTGVVTLAELHTAGLEVSSNKGSASGYAGLDSGGRVPFAQLPTALGEALSWVGTWNANTNSPALASGTGTAGYTYTVSTAGTTTLDGISQWNVGDKVVFDGTASVWQKIDGLATEVVSVAGRTGAVTLAVADVSGAAPTASPVLTTPTIAAAPTGADNSLLIPSTSWVRGYVASLSYSYTLAGLTDVALSTLTSGQVLTYNGAHWVNSTPSAGAVSSVAGRTGAVTLAVADVSGAAPLASPALTTPTVVAAPSGSDNSLLLPSTSWVRAYVTGLAYSATLSGLSDVTLSTLTSGQVLTWNGTKWANATPTSGGSTTLAGDTDVAISSPTTGQVLTYSTATSKWSNQPATAGSTVLEHNGGASTTVNLLNVVNGGYIVSPINGATATTLDPANTDSGLTLSNGNRTASGTPSSNSKTRGLDYKNSGKWYFEVTYTSLSGSPAHDYIGICNVNATTANLINGMTNAAGMRVTDQTFEVNGAATNGGGGSNLSGTTVCIAVDIDNALMWFKTSTASSWTGAFYGVGMNPATDTAGMNISSITPSGGIYPCAVQDTASGSTFAFNFGQSSYAGTPPTGYNNWNSPAVTSSGAASYSATITIPVTLAADTDVSISSPSNGQHLVYNSGTGLWTNTTVTLGSATLAGDSDVVISSPVNGQVLTYNGSTSKWNNTTVFTGGTAGTNTPTIVQTATASSTSSVGSITFGTATTPGNLIAIFATTYGGGAGATVPTINAPTGFFSISSNLSQTVTYEGIWAFAGIVGINGVAAGTTYALSGSDGQNTGYYAVEIAGCGGVASSYSQPSTSGSNSTIVVPAGIINPAISFSAKSNTLNFLVLEQDNGGGFSSCSSGLTEIAAQTFGGGHSSCFFSYPSGTKGTNQTVTWTSAPSTYTIAGQFAFNG